MCDIIFLFLSLVPVKEEATAGTTAKAEEESHLPTHEQTSLPPAHLDRCLREREREGDWSSEGGLLPELGPAQAGPGSSEPWEGERTECPHIAHGEPLTDRRSTFQAHAAAVSSKTEVHIYNDTHFKSFYCVPLAAKSCLFVSVLSLCVCRWQLLLLS